LSTKRSLADETGTLQVADARLFANDFEGYDYLIPPDLEKKVMDIIQMQPGVVGATPRISLSGLIGDERGSTLLVARGIVPENCVQTYRCIITGGQPLSENGNKEIVLGSSLAQKLGVNPGDKINVSTSTVSGNFNAATVEVVGIASFNNETIEQQLGIFPLSFAQKLLRTEGVERILVRLEKVDAADEFAQKLRSELEKEKIALQVKTWKELNTVYDSLSTFWSAFSGFTYIAVFVLVFFSVLEVLTMSFLERIREVGSIRALGTTRLQVFKSFVLEGVLVGVLGGAGGVLIGAIIVLLINFVGLNWTPPGAVIPEPLTLRINAWIVFLPFIASMVSTFVGALFPAWKNSRISITEALRSV
jgi:putative ABC transport system permease protein